MAKRSKYLPSKTLQAKYERQLRKVAKHAGALVEAHVDGSALIDEQGMMTAAKLYSEALEPWAAIVSGKMFRELDKKNKEAYTEFSQRVGALLRVELHSETGALARSLITEQVGLIKSIPLEAATRAQEYALEAALDGERAAYVAEQLKKTTDVTESRATLIARTEIAKSNAAINQSRSQALGLDKYIWRTAQDDRVRESHAELEGTEQSFSNPPVVGDEGSFNPGEVYNCVLGGANVEASTAINIFYRRRYTGELTSLVLDNGVVLTATPNHPVLTERGFVGIDDVDVGDNLICTVNQSFSAAKFYVDGLDITFEQLFDALNMYAGFSASSIVGGQFHGDATNEEVDVIRPDWALIYERYRFVDEKISKLNLTDADEALCRALLSCNRGFAALLKATFPTSASLMSSFRLIEPLLREHFTPFDLFCFTLCSTSDFSDTQVSRDNATVDIEGFGNLVFAYSILVHGFDSVKIKMDCVMSAWDDMFDDNAVATKMFAKDVWMDGELRSHVLQKHTGMYQLCRVLEKSTSNLTSHVFNLETTTGLYHTESAIKSNCRCYAEPVVSITDT